MSGSYMNVPSWQASIQYGNSAAGIERFPEDMEDSDRQALGNYIERYFNEMYLVFEPEIIHGMDKDYFLPALKVLKFIDGKYYSPGYESEWRDMELKAECRKLAEQAYLPTHKMVTDDNGTQYIVSVPPDLDEYRGTTRHNAPEESCDCGIYGSVNLEEILEYVMTYQSPNWQKTGHWQAQHLGTFASASANLPPNPKPVLCIIEPSPDAKVILCRKGWKASHAFISEIVEETISERDASQLLSIAWHRPIDVRRLHASR
jgi:hypothetical protein